MNDLAFIGEMLDATFDHQHLNDHLPDDVPATAENLAYVIWLFVKQRGLPANVSFCSVTVSETPKTFARHGGAL